MVGVSLSACSPATTRNPQLEADYHARVDCASASLDATAYYIGKGQSSAEMERAALKHGEAAVELGSQLGKSRDEVMSEIREKYNPGSEGNEVARQRMKDETPKAEACLSRLA